MARRPDILNDRDNWGEVLNDYLDVSLNEDGTIKDAALAPVVGPLVTDALADDDTPAQAAAAAVDAEIAGRPILEGGTILEDDIAFAVVDEDGRRTWLEAGMDGGPTDHSIDKIAEHITGAVDVGTDVVGVSFAVVDEDDRRTWIEAGLDGKPTARSLQLIGDGLGVMAEQPDYPEDDWAHWGDSMTAWGFPAEMALLTGRQHYNGGISGQKTPEIAARQGGVPTRVTVTGNTIPASGAVAVTQIVNTPLSTNASITGTLGGVPGTLSWTSPDPDSHVFTRTNPGDAVPIDPLTRFIVDSSADMRARHVTIWTGRNSLSLGLNGIAVSYIQQMIDYLTPRVRRVLVMEVAPIDTETTGTPERDNLDALNAELEAAFPQYFVPVATWLRTTDAATAAEITFTSQDLTDIGNGITPTSFRRDNLHPSDDANVAIAAYLYEQAQTRGWL